MRFFQRVTSLHPLCPFWSTYQMPLDRGRERSLGVINDPFLFSGPWRSNLDMTFLLLILNQFWRYHVFLYRVGLEGKGHLPGMLVKHRETIGLAISKKLVF